VRTIAASIVLFFSPSIASTSAAVRRLPVSSEAHLEAEPEPRPA
jgi:hypothetical protein